LLVYGFGGATMQLKHALMQCAKTHVVNTEVKGNPVRESERI